MCYVLYFEFLYCTKGMFLIWPLGDLFHAFQLFFSGYLALLPSSSLFMLKSAVDALGHLRFA